MDYYFSHNPNFIINKIISWVSQDEVFFLLLGVYIKITITSIPVILALTYFIYREQQNISLRHQNLSSLFFYFCFSISGVILAYYFEANRALSKEIYLPHIVSSNPYKVFFLIIMVILTFIFLFLLVSKLLLGINFIYQLKNSRKKIWKFLNLVYFSHNNRVSKQYYKSIHNHMESIFQILEYALSNKMDKLFKEEFAKLSVLLEKLMEQSPHKKLIIYPKRLTELHPTQFPDLYSVILSNIGNLTFSLYKNNRFSEMESTFNILKALEPNKVKELYPAYFNGIEDISLRLLTIKEFPFEKMLSFLESFSKSENIKEKEQTNVIGVMLIYQSVLKVAAENNDVKNVTAITYSLDTFLNGLQHDTSNQLYPNVLTKIRKSILASMRKAFGIHHETITHLNEVALYILFQGTLKSIEIGSYGVTGQLIKRITTDFKGKTINKVFDNFYKTKGWLKTAYNEFDKEFLLNDLITDFSFNNRSFRYCIQKMIFLLLAQEALIIDKKISFTEFYKSDHDFIGLHYFSDEYLDYIASKIKSVGNGYGLIFNKTDNFIDQLAIYIKEKIKNPPSKQDIT